MGNEITTQNMLNYGNFNPQSYNMGMTMPMNAGIFNGSMGQMGITDYSNDLFAPDFIKQPYSQYTNYQTPNNNMYNPQQPQSIFSTPQPQVTQTPAQTFTGNDTPEEVPQDNKEEQIQKTNIGKKLGIVAGLSIPVISSASKMFSGAKFSDVFKFKDLGLKGIAFALAGWCAGSIIDGFLNSTKVSSQNA